MGSSRVSRNDPCPCGSGKKYKPCCLAKDLAAAARQPLPTLTDLHGRPKKRVEFPLGTVAHYGPDDRTTTKISAGVIRTQDSEPILQRWVATDVTTNPKAQEEMKAFSVEHGMKSVAIGAGNMGCPHEEGKDFLQVTDCPFCPFWAGKQGSNRRV